MANWGLVAFWLFWAIVVICITVYSLNIAEIKIGYTDYESCIGVCKYALRIQECMTKCAENTLKTLNKC